MSEASTTLASTPSWLGLIGKIAPFTSIALYMAPIPTILDIAKRKGVGDLPLLPYTSMISNSLIWVVYGLLISQPKLWTANIIGLTLSSFYFLSYARFAPPDATSLPGKLNQHVGWFLALLAFVLWFAKSNNPEPIGQIGLFINLAMYASPLAAMKVVLQTKSSEALPLPLTLASLISCMSWSVTGYFDMHDIYVYGPPVLGVLCGIVQLSLKIFYGESSTQSTKLSPALNSREVVLKKKK